ncbi:hypothetical protein RFF05_07335 [Bengtsoniella intestinalis]|uniref:hypothetical protein n=1 Tax=Bengtsoniella intestinalis TaxID=3073143 RepID=UPI00391F623F
MNHTFSRRNFIQNLIIGVLLCTTIGLFVQTQVYNLGQTPSSYFSQLIGATPDDLTVQNLSGAALSTPVSVVVSTSFGRYGSPHISTQDTEFTLLKDLLAQGLSALSATASGTNEPTFLQAIDSSSIYFDFQLPLPSSVIAGMVGLTETANQTQMQRLVLAPDDTNAVLLYWWDGDDTYAYITTDIDLVAFYELQESYQADNVFFAFEGSSLSSQLNNLDPFSLFDTTTAAYPQLSATTPTWNETTLLTQLGFNPYTNSRYTETNGTQVVFQEDDRLYLSADGTVHYESDGQSRQLTLSLTQSTITAYGLSSSASYLLHSLLSSMMGEASLAISAYTQLDTQTIITFDYQIQGIPIALSHGQPAATMVLEGNVVTDLTIYPRQYYQDDSDSLLLPLAQAAAVATRGSNLTISYVDYSASNLSAMWIYR